MDEDSVTDTAVAMDESSEINPHQSNPVESDAPAADEASRLVALDTHVRNQDDLERDITRQADRMLLEQEDERDSKRLDRTRREKEKLDTQIVRLLQRVSQPIGTSARVRLQEQIGNLESRNTALAKDLKDIQQRMENRQQGEGDGPPMGTGRMPNESRRDYLIRTGKITPFSQMGTGPNEGNVANLHDALIDAEDERDETEALEESKYTSTVSHRDLVRPGFGFDETSDVGAEREPADRPKKRRKVDAEAAIDDEPAEGDGSESYVASELESLPESEEDFLPEEDLQPARRKEKAKDDMEDLSGLDDGNEKLYQTRLQNWVRRRSAARNRVVDAQSGDDAGVHEESHQPEWLLPHPTVPDLAYGNGYSIPGDIYPYLFDYQKTGVQWLWELHQQQVGGIIGDEMGLGKTIQVIAFLAGLHYSKRLTKPVIVVCPATVMKQWVNEFHRWWPPFRVSILHASGSGMVNIGRESTRESALMSETWNPNERRAPGGKAAREIVNRVLREGHVLVTTYSGLQSYASMLIEPEWGCAILDEGHKIRNPNTSITIHCKELRTAHRLILSGTPMQNNLTELWSLFDFVFPMRLGTLVSFRNQFDFPIRQGGYANASNLQVQTAAKCAETLKEAIKPYLLQRFKIDVAADLPKKTEQVLFCKLTKPQRAAYKTFLGSQEMVSILHGRRQVLYGVDVLRKICNHPDLLAHKLQFNKPDYGSAPKSGKMQVVKSLLELWKNTGHKTLLFAQHRIMLDILEKFVKSLGRFKYRRMDGSTPVRHRQAMVDEFNTKSNIDVFLLTTKVGGLGVNLTGADRVIIYDPDWNPSTDLQARERAWRLGQKRDVSVYRLMTVGTIEEKIYHRQIFKQFLTNKIMKDPKQRQTFQFGDLHDLFSLGEEQEGPTETSKLFKETGVTYEKEGQSGKEREDIGKVEGVSSMEKLQEEEKSEQTGGSPSEARIMEGILSQSGVHSSLEHENIVNGKRVIRADPKIIEAEAKKVAGEAAAELRKAEAAARSVPIGMPTWTGQFGVAGRPEEGGISRSTAARGAAAGPPSASILANLSSRNTPPSRARPRTNRGADPGPGGKEFVAMIRDFITAHGGSVYTKMLIDQFNRFCTTPQRTAEFKEILKTIAVLDKGGRGGRGKWTLKPEYYAKPAGGG